MIKEFEYKGVWWLPTNTAKRIPGTLLFTPKDGATLDLMGSFKDMQHLGEALDPEIILGETTNGKLVTLYGCLETRSTMSLPGRIVSVLHANYIFVGVHFSEPQAILFDEINVRYLYLDEWVSKSGFTIQIPREGNLENITLKYSLPQSIQIASNADQEISLNFTANIPMPTITESNIKQKVEIKIKALEQRKFWYFKTLIYKMQNFLSLGMMEATWPIMIQGKTGVNRVIIDGTHHYEPVEIFYQLAEIPEVNNKIDSHEMFFLLTDIADGITRYLEKWFKISVTLEPVLDLYFGAIYNKKIYLQHMFLNLSQALESYHRRIFEGKYQSDEEYLKGLYDSLMKSIPDNLDSDFKTSLKTRMKYLNEYSLRKRLFDLSQKYAEILSLCIHNMDKLIDNTVNTRNFLTHYDLSLSDKVKSGEDLYELCEKLKFFLEICLLFEIGLASEKIKVLVERNKDYKYLKRMPG